MQLEVFYLAKRRHVNAFCGAYVAIFLIICASAHAAGNRGEEDAKTTTEGQSFREAKAGLELGYAHESARCLLYNYIMQLGFQSMTSGGLGMAAEVSRTKPAKVAPGSAQEDHSRRAFSALPLFLFALIRVRVHAQPFGAFAFYIA